MSLIDITIIVQNEKLAAEVDKLTEQQEPHEIKVNGKVIEAYTLENPAEYINLYHDLPRQYYTDTKSTELNTPINEGDLVAWTIYASTPYTPPKEGNDTLDELRLALIKTKVCPQQNENKDETHVFFDKEDEAKIYCNGHKACAAILYDLATDKKKEICYSIYFFIKDKCVGWDPKLEVRKKIINETSTNQEPSLTASSI